MASHEWMLNRRGLARWATDVDSAAAVLLAVERESSSNTKTESFHGGYGEGCECTVKRDVCAGGDGSASHAVAGPALAPLLCFQAGPLYFDRL